MPDTMDKEFDTSGKQHLWERKLLDFSLRNNLLNRKLGKRVVRLIVPDLEAAEDRLALGEDFTLAPRPEAAKKAKGAAADAPKAPVDAEGLHDLAAEEMAKNRLMADLDEADLGTRLKVLYRASRTAMEENGAGTLFLALGVLRWYESDRGDTPREAPILLLPVDLVRKTGQNYVLRARDEETLLNVTLVELLRQQYKVDLAGAYADAEGTQQPTLLHEENGTLAVGRILEVVAAAVAELPGWQVLPLVELGLFSFNKFVMWNDIRRGAGQLAASPVVRSLMEGRVTLTDLDELADARALDKTLRPDELALPMDVDSSQMEAVIESGRGKSFILYGPPGTGKSQTITNMIANALYHGKRVLFVAEKMAALTVVQKRLEKIGIGAFCLELHSNKVTKQHFLAQMNEALEAVRLQGDDDFSRRADELFESRSQLIRYMDALHQPAPSGLSLYDCLSRYLAIEGDELTDGLPATATAARLETWRELVEGLDTVLRVTGHPAQHPLRGFNPREWTLESRATAARLLPGFGAAAAEAEALRRSLLKTYTTAFLKADPDAELREWKAQADRFFLIKAFTQGSYVKRFAARFVRPTGLQPAFDAIPADLERLRTYQQARALVDSLHAVADLDMADTEAAAHTEQWLAHLDRGKDWCLWTERKRRLEDEGLACVVRYLTAPTAAGALPTPREAWNALAKGIYHRMAMQMIDADPQLRTFNGLIFEDVIAHYKLQTARFQELTKRELYCRLAARIPTQTLAAAASSELGILKKAIAGKGRNTSIRKLIDQIPSLLPKLAPCMLMSPLSVAQFLDLEGEKFDLVIFDEASQMPTCEAVGAIARGQALVCVGDPKQMPPTSFFEKSQSDDDEEESIALEDMDSILDDCIALSMPGHYLTWHYRSKHESLIAFSNREYYDGKLYTFPSVDDRSVKVRLVQVDGTYDKGRTRSNEAEARAIVAEALRRLADPDLSRLSIGIVAFSKAQQDLIEDLLEGELAQHPDLEARAYEAEEPIFVKNLENVQGDERDVILFSIGYGPDPEGRVSMNFGPLNVEGGERRLNVAVSRARCEMMVFAILRPEQIDLSRTQAKGVEGLKRFLEFAAGRRQDAEGFASAGRTAADTAATDLPAQIAAALAAHGYDVRIGLGRSRFKIDVAVVHPDRPDEYLLGIFCDGKNYYETKTARDREVCQPGVMTMLGWNTMRVWSIDWYEHRDQVVDRILARLGELRQGAAPAPEPADVPDVPRFDPAHEAAVAPEPAAGVIRPYVAAQLKPAPKRLPSFSETDGTISKAVRDVIAQTLEAEQPVTNRLLYRRVAAHLGLTDSVRLRRFVDWQLEPHHRDPLSDGDDVPEKERIVTWWKDADAMWAFAGFRTDSGRAWDEMPLCEVVGAMRCIVGEQGSLPPDDLKRAALRALGFARRTPRLDALAERALREVQP